VLVFPIVFDPLRRPQAGARLPRMGILMNALRAFAPFMFVVNKDLNDRFGL